VIAYREVTAWAVDHPWPTREQVEQDLLLSRAICAIAEDDYLGAELVFRGGTALHKLHLPQALRYSEDLDYVRSTASGISGVTGALLDLGRSLGFEVASRISVHPKVFWRCAAQTGVPLRIKIEVNTHERSPVLPLITVGHEVTSPWWTGRSAVRTFDPAELVATKIRALYQRSKGRDLFDLWLALTVLELDPDRILAAFGPYRPVGLTARMAIGNLERKTSDRTFRSDLDPLHRERPSAYDVDAAAQLVTDLLLARIGSVPPTSKGN